ncbi:MAG: hypothetical protein O2971_04150 [Proteobacteria bacterium]|nr:hypothetical protein [Pseudomonadota bacterium]
MKKAFLTILFLFLSSTTMAAENLDVSWQVFADCAAGYVGNWKSRQADPERGPEMSAVILEIAADYEAAALKAMGGAEAAAKTIRAYIEANTDRFVTMDKAGELNRFLEECPQPYD